MVYVFAVNTAVSLISGLSLLLIWRQDRSHAFARSIALAQLCNVAAVLSYTVWRGPLSALNLVGVIGIAAGSAGVFLYGSRAVLQLAGKRHSHAAHMGVVALLFMVYGVVLLAEAVRVYAFVNMVMYAGAGLYALRLLWDRGWKERAIGLAIFLLGLNFINLLLPGEAGVTTQLACGTVLRVTLALAYAFAALDRSRLRSERMRQRFETLSENSVQGPAQWQSPHGGSAARSAQARRYCHPCPPVGLAHPLGRQPRHPHPGAR